MPEGRRAECGRAVAPKRPQHIVFDTEVGRQRLDHPAVLARVDGLAQGFAGIVRAQQRRAPLVFGRGDQTGAGSRLCIDQRLGKELGKGRQLAQHIGALGGMPLAGQQPVVAAQVLAGPAATELDQRHRLEAAFEQCRDSLLGSALAQVDRAQHLAVEGDVDQFAAQRLMQLRHEVGIARRPIEEAAGHLRFEAVLARQMRAPVVAPSLQDGEHVLAERGKQHIEGGGLGGAHRQSVVGLVVVQPAGERGDQPTQGDIGQQAAKVVNALMPIDTDEADRVAPVAGELPEDRIGHERQTRSQRQQQDEERPVGRGLAPDQRARRGQVGMGGG